MYEPLVSIIMPVYNCEAYIEEALESVRQQTYRNWELIIVDDKSTDKSLVMVKNFVHQDKRIKLINLDNNMGPTSARNRAIKEAKGKYIAFLDSDDMWLPHKLQTQLSFLNDNSLVLTYSAYETIDANSKYINTRNVPEVITYEDMLKSNYIGNLTGIYDVNFFGKVYLENIGHEDYVMWLGLIKQVVETKGLNEPLAKYRILSSSISSNKFKALVWQWNIYRKVEKLNIFTSIYSFIFYIYNALKKRSI